MNTVQSEEEPDDLELEDTIETRFAHFDAPDLDQEVTVIRTLAQVQAQIDHDDLTLRARQAREAGQKARAAGIAAHQRSKEARQQLKQQFLTREQVAAGRVSIGQQQARQEPTTTLEDALLWIVCIAGFVSVVWVVIRA